MGAPINQRKCNTFMERNNYCDQLMDLATVGSIFAWMGPLMHELSHIFLEA